MRKFTRYSALPKLSLVLSLAFVTGFVQKSDAQEVITIQQAVEKTLSNNLQVKQSQLSESLSDENFKQSKNALLPTLNGSGSYNYSFGRSVDQTSYSFNNGNFFSFNGNLTANVNLFDGLQRINQIRQNKLLLAADKTNTDKIKNDLILQVITSYLQILYNKDLLTAANQQLTVAKQQLEREQHLMDAGNKTLADLSQAKSQVATAELNSTNAVNALTISYLTLAQLMDIPSATKYEVQAPLLNNFNNPSTSVNAADIYDEAAKIFPDIKLASLRTKASLKAIDVARGSYFPTLSLGAGMSSNYSDVPVGQSFDTGVFNIIKQRNGNQISEIEVPVRGQRAVSADAFGRQLKDHIGQYVGISLQIPIFNGFNARSSVRKAKIAYLQNETQEQLAKNNLNKVIYQAVADLKAAEGRFQSTTNTFLAQKDAFYVIEQRYEVGLVNSLDYSTSQTNKNKAEIDMIQAKYDLLFRAKVIDYYLGKQIVF